MRQTNADLRRHYRTANRLYFGNALPKDLPVRYARIQGIGVTWVRKGVAIEIEITKRIQWTSRLSIQTLIHEMLHVKFPKRRGHKWHDALMRAFAQAGALDGLW